MKRWKTWDFWDSLLLLAWFMLLALLVVFAIIAGLEKSKISVPGFLTPEEAVPLASTWFIGVSVGRFLALTVERWDLHLALAQIAASVWLIFWKKPEYPSWFTLLVQHGLAGVSVAFFLGLLSIMFSYVLRQRRSMFWLNKKSVGSILKAHLERVHHQQQQQQHQQQHQHQQHQSKDQENQ